MRVDRFSVVGLHGFVDATLDFYPDLTVIVGRNGSGKTSVLNFMSSLIRLDVEAIGKMNFESAKLTLKDNSLGVVVIEATNNSESKKLSLIINDEKPLDISLDISPSALRYSAELETYRARAHPDRRARVEQMISDHAKWSNLAASVRKSTRLTFVKLDRTILAIDSEGSASYENGNQPRGGRYEPGATPTRDPIEDVIQVMRRNQLAFRRTADRIQRAASTEFIKLHFAPPKMPKGKTSTEKQLRQKLQELKRRVTSSQLLANTQEIAELIGNFFNEFENLLNTAFPNESLTKRAGRRTLHEETIEVLIAVKEQQLTQLLRIFEHEQEETAKAYSPIRKFMDVAESFLNESGKSLRFLPDNLELGFVVTKSIQSSETDEVESQGQIIRSVRELSSGERQVLIVLTYLAFFAGMNSIYVIDEPELSLHIEWQRELVGALTTLRPENCQIILATHSPEIAGRAKQNCKVLRPSYFPQV